MQEWLPIVAALVGALATFGVWSYIGRRRLAIRAAELETNARDADDRARIGADSAAAPQHGGSADRGRQPRTVPRVSRARVAPRAARWPAADADLHRHRSFPRLQPAVRPQGRRRSLETGRPRPGRSSSAAPATWWRVIIATNLRSSWRPPTARAHSTFPNACARPLKISQVPAANDAPAAVVTASVATATAVPQRESAWEELDLIKAARHALREARATRRQSRPARESRHGGSARTRSNR